MANQAGRSRRSLRGLRGVDGWTHTLPVNPDGEIKVGPFIVRSGESSLKHLCIRGEPERHHMRMGSRINALAR